MVLPGETFYYKKSVTIQQDGLWPRGAHFKGVCRLDGDGQAPGMGSCGPWSGRREAIHRAAE